MSAQVRRPGGGTSEQLKYLARLARRSLINGDSALAETPLADSLAVRLDYTDAPRAATLERAQAAVDAALKLDAARNQCLANY